MKRKALKIKLLFILFTISCLSAFSQAPLPVHNNVRNIWFPALKAQTDGDNWTIKTFNDLLGRTAPPSFKKGTGVEQQDLTLSQQRRPVTLQIVDLSNNNLTGVIEVDKDDTETWTWLDALVRNQEKSRFYRNTSFRFSHNKLTSVRAKITYDPRGGNPQDLWLDHNLLTTFEPIANNKVVIRGERGATNSLRINNNQLKGIPGSWRGSITDNNGLHFVSNKIKEFRAENNFFNFTDLIKLVDLIDKKRNAISGKNSNFALTIAPQSPLGEVSAPQTVAEETVVPLAFDKTLTPHRNNVYGWELNGEQTVLSGNEINVTVNTVSAGMYRCKVTNPELEDLVLYSRDFPVFMTKTGNADPTDLTLDNTSAPAKTPANAIVGMFSGTDPEDDDLYFRLYKIVGDNSSFRIIDGNTLVSSTTLFEYSYQESYTIKVEAYDIYGGTFQKDITITRGAVITGAFPTNIKLSKNTIAENTAAKVGDIQLVGVGDATGFTYGLIADTKDNAFFEVKEAAIHVKEGKWLDFERKRSYTIRLKAINPNSFSLTKDLIVTAEDRNDVPNGVFITNTQIGLGQQVGTLVGTLFATDDDAENTEFTFQANNEFFSIERKINVVTKRPFIASEVGVKDFSVLVRDPDGATKTFLLRIKITTTPSATLVSQSSRELGTTPNNAPNRLRLFGRLVANVDRVDVEQCFGKKTYDLNRYFNDRDGDRLYYIITSDSETTIYASLEGSNLLLQEVPVTSSAIATGVTVTILAKDDKGGESTHVVKFKVVANTTDEDCVCNRG